MGHTVLYVGMTNNLERRYNEHVTGFYKNSFSKRYRLKKLVYVEEYPEVVQALAREKQLKAGSRQRKIDLIDSVNPRRLNLIE